MGELPIMLHRLYRWGLFAAAWAAALPVMAAVRFPRPDFTTDYHPPDLADPPPRGVAIEFLDLLLLAAALWLAGWLALRRRSRRGLWLLTIFCLLWFGFLRRGCVCAVGSIQNLALGFADASYLIPLTVIVFFALPLLWTLFTGRTFCAAVCPLGAVQELALWRPVRTPAWINHLLGLVPWIYLSIAVLFAAMGAEFLICRWDPFVGFFRFGAPFHMVIFGVGIILVSLFIGRPYCRFLCPYGALLGLMSRFSRRHVTITPETCVQCGLCESACPYGAIRTPLPSAPPEPRSKGIRRLAMLLAMIPLILLLGAGSGFMLGRLLSQHHPQVSLAMDIHRAGAGNAQDGMSLEREAFLIHGLPEAPLFAEARILQRRFAVGGGFIGLILGLVFCAKLFGLSIWRSRTDYEPDRALCFSCARCFSHCPVEQKRRRTT